MSWLRNHMRHFVIPGVHALARADGRTLSESDIKVSDREVRPASVCEYPEAGMLYAVCASILRKSDKTREVALGLCRSIGKPGDDKFVYELDSGNRVRELSAGYDGVEGADVLHSFIVNSVRSLKRRTRKQATVVYPGRDVWCWEVLSRKVGQPSVYDSRVSRDVAEHAMACKAAISRWQIPDWNRTVLFDSGYSGTVPRAIGRAASLDKVNIIMLSAEKSNEQIFPTHAKARRKALACEYLAKYHRRAVVRDGAPFQQLADLDEFIKSALLTIWLWHHVSPRRLPSWKDKSPQRLWPKVPHGAPTIQIGNGSNLVVHGAVPALNVNANFIQPSNVWSGVWNIVSSGTASTASVLMDPGTSVTGTGTTFGFPPMPSMLLDPATMITYPMSNYANAANSNNASSVSSKPGGPATAIGNGPAAISAQLPTRITAPIALGRNGKPIVG